MNALAEHVKNNMGAFDTVRGGVYLWSVSNQRDYERTTASTT